MLTVLAMVAFAANSLLGRLALRDAAIDPATFTLVRFISGAVMLALVTAPARSRLARPATGTWTTAAVLAVYSLPFAFAYTQLSAGTGALILFGCVQVTMLLAAVTGGEQPRLVQWAGVALALAGLVYLVLPGLTAPPPLAALLMAVAGVSWGVYSLRGRASLNPVQQTSDNFVRALPFIIIASLPWLPRMHADSRGLALAAASGSVTSGLGYIAWYSALRRLSALRASVVQLAVPVIAAAGGVLLLGETLSLRLGIAAALVLSGIAMAILAGRRG